MKAPCESCGHMTTLRCVHCGRALCAIHAAWNRDSQSHDGGRHPCRRPERRPS